MPLISQTSEYALRAVVHLAGRARDDEPSQTLQQIAGATKVPSDYLSKVLQQLVRADLVVSRRGSGGGFQLSQAPENITLYNVICAVDSLPRIETCPLGLSDHVRLCPLHGKLDAAMAYVEDAFQSTTIAELVTGKKALCKESM